MLSAFDKNCLYLTLSIILLPLVKLIDKEMYNILLNTVSYKISNKKEYFLIWMQQQLNNNQ